MIIGYRHSINCITLETEKICRRQQNQYDMAPIGTMQLRDTAAFLKVREISKSININTSKNHFNNSYLQIIIFSTINTNV